MSIAKKILGGGLTACLTLATPCIKYYEGLSNAVYADPVGIPTQCYGHTGPDVSFGSPTKTDQQCMDLLERDETLDVEAVQDCITTDLQPWEAAALVSFVHNAGKNALCSSTMARMINSGADPSLWCDQLHRWVYGHKAGITIRLPGLIKRRDTEYRICIGDSAPVLAG